jgi:protein-tyrosine-phosphatase
MVCSVFGKNWSLDLRAVDMFLGMWDQVRLMCSYCRKHDITEVPDPYYGGPAGFDKVLDLLEDACEGLLDSILTTRTQVMEPAQSVLPDA